MYNLNFQFKKLISCLKVQFKKKPYSSNHATILIVPYRGAIVLHRYINSFLLQTVTLQVLYFLVKSIFSVLTATRSKSRFQITVIP